MQKRGSEGGDQTVLWVAPPSLDSAKRALSAHRVCALFATEGCGSEGGAYTAFFVAPHSRLFFCYLVDMKPIGPSILRLLFVICFLAASANVGNSQSEGEGSQALYMQHQSDSERVVKIDSGRKLKVWTQDGQLHAGKLTQVSDSSFFLGKEEISYSKTKKVKLDKGEGGRIGGLTGLLLGAFGIVIGLAFSLLGLYAANSATQNTSNGCAQAMGGFFLLILGILIGAVGIIFAIIGIIAYTIGTAVARNFKLDGKWRIVRRTAGN